MAAEGDRGTHERREPCGGDSNSAVRFAKAAVASEDPRLRVYAWRKASPVLLLMASATPCGSGE
jgi:hypothetical protein